MGYNNDDDFDDFISSVGDAIDNEYSDYNSAEYDDADYIYKDSNTIKHEPPDSPKRKHRKKHHLLRRLLSVILILAIVVWGVWTFGGKQPLSSDASSLSRKDGFSTILLIGTDEGGSRTDTLMLIALDSENKMVSILSIPRDTYVYGGYSVPKINSAYGSAGGGEAGIEELMTRISEIVGYKPDGYVMVGLDAFIEIVDFMGGVEFDVPMDMYYSDPAQDLYIDLKAGLQTLNGEQAMGLVRYRSGYALADLTRVSVQRDFVKAAMSQWLTPGIILKVPGLLSIINASVETDLTTGNIFWLGKTLLTCNFDDVVMETLPGSSVTWTSGSYYVLNKTSVLALINESFNPYENDITADMINIRES